MSTTTPSDPTSNVVPFRVGRGQTHAEAEIQHRERQERRHAAIILTANKKPKMTNDDDRKIVATNLGEILDRFERERKGKKEALLRTVNMGEAGNSTKQLFNYTLPRFDDNAQSKLKKRISKLVRRIEKYMLLAQAAAQVAGWEEKEVLIDLFRGSSYDFGVTLGPVPSLPDYLFSLNDILHVLEDWLVRESCAETYFKTLQEFPVWNEWGQYIVDMPVSPLRKSGASSHVPSAAYYGKAIPGITLYRILAAQVPVDFVSGRGVDAPDCYDDDPPPDVPTERISYRRYFDVRLGIAPISSSGKMGLVFDQRCVNELWNTDQRIAYTFCTLLPKHWRTDWAKADSVSVRDHWENVDLFGALNAPPGVLNQVTEANDLVDPFQGWLRSDDETILPADLSEIHTKYINDRDEYLSRTGQDFVEEVNPLTCKKYLSVEIDNKVECDHHFARYPTTLECPSNTVAARIETALYSDEPDDRLDTLLKSEIEHRWSLLDACLKRRRSIINQSRHKLFARWGVNE